MSRRPRRNHTRVFKSKVALAAIKGDKAIAELSQQFDVHANQITQWKIQLLERAGIVFEGSAHKESPLIDRTHPLPIKRQAKALGIARSTVYALPRPISECDLQLMKRIDRLHLEMPFAGARMLRDLLALKGIKVGRKHVATLMKRMITGSKFASGWWLFDRCISCCVIDGPDWFDDFAEWSP